MTVERLRGVSREMERAGREPRHRLELGLVHVGRLDVDDKRPDRRVDRVRDLVLQPRELHEVSVRLLAEVERVCIDDELERAVDAPEIEQRDTWDVRAVRERLERGDRGRPRLW